MQLQEVEPVVRAPGFQSQAYVHPGNLLAGSDHERC